MADRASQRFPIGEKRRLLRHGKRRCLAHDARKSSGLGFPGVAAAQPERDRLAGSDSVNYACARTLAITGSTSLQGTSCGAVLFFTATAAVAPAASPMATALPVTR